MEYGEINELITDIRFFYNNINIKNKEDCVGGDLRKAKIYYSEQDKLKKINGVDYLDAMKLDESIKEKIKEYNIPLYTSISLGHMWSESSDFEEFLKEYHSNMEHWYNFTESLEQSKKNND